MLVPGRFTTTSIKTPDGGELEIRLTDGGHWQMKAKLVAEKDWRPLCRGHIDGSIFDAPGPMISPRSRSARCWSTRPVAGSRSGVSSCG